MLANRAATCSSSPLPPPAEKTFQAIDRFGTTDWVALRKIAIL
jgi:hypothetical protein